MQLRVSMNMQGATRFVGSGITHQEFKRWRDFYQTIFGVTLPIDKIKMPTARPEFNRVIVVAKGLTPNRVYAACQERFLCVRHYTNLDEDVVNNERAPDTTYALFARGGRESDKELADFSADELSKKKIHTLTLLEYLLYQLKYFNETKKLLDEKDITMCAGSRYRDGRVPTAISHKGGLKTHWCGSAEKNPRLRAREVTSA